jgi:hypothetical protein
VCRTRWGDPAALLAAKNNTKDELFISFFSTLHLQLRGKYFILNCHSNFAEIIRMLVKWGGCSAAKQPYVFCLNNQFGRFKICDLQESATNLTACRERQKWEVRRLVNAELTQVPSEPSFFRRFVRARL